MDAAARNGRYRPGMDPSSSRVGADVHPVDVAIALGLGALSFLRLVTGSAKVATAGGLAVVLLLLESLPLVVAPPLPARS